MITNLKEAKAKLSQLVEVAARGEDVIITIRGKAKARLSAIAPELDETFRKRWADRIEEARAAYTVHPPAGDSQNLWDDLREER